MAGLESRVAAVERKLTEATQLFGQVMDRVIRLESKPADDQTARSIELLAIKLLAQNGGQRPPDFAEQLSQVPGALELRERAPERIIRAIEQAGESYLATREAKGEH